MSGVVWEDSAVKKYRCYNYHYLIRKVIRKVAFFSVRVFVPYHRG